MEVEEEEEEVVVVEEEEEEVIVSAGEVVVVVVMVSAGERGASTEAVHLRVFVTAVCLIEVVISLNRLDLVVRPRLSSPFLCRPAPLTLGKLLHVT